MEFQDTSNRQRFTKADRILERRQFRHLSEHGNKIHSRHFIALVERGKENRSRIGITVSKKVGNAVTRNRIKRLVREYYRKNRHALECHWDIHLIAKREAAEPNTQKVLLSLEKSFKRINASQDERTRGHNNY